MQLLDKSSRPSLDRQMDHLDSTLPGLFSCVKSVLDLKPCRHDAQSDCAAIMHACRLRLRAQQRVQPHCRQQKEEAWRALAWMTWGLCGWACEWNSEQPSSSKCKPSDLDSIAPAMISRSAFWPSPALPPFPSFTPTSILCHILYPNVCPPAGSDFVAQPSPAQPSPAPLSFFYPHINPLPHSVS